MSDSPESRLPEVLVSSDDRTVYVRKDVQHEVLQQGNGTTEVLVEGSVVKVTGDNESGVMNISVSSERERSTVGYSRKYHDAYDRIFGSN